MSNQIAAAFGLFVALLIGAGYVLMLIGAQVVSTPVWVFVLHTASVLLRKLLRLRF